MPTPLNVLIVEDSAEDANLVLRELQQAGFTPTHQRVQTTDQFLNALQENTWNIILCDYTMPAFDAITAFDLLQQSDREIPFIVVTGRINEETAVDCLKRGVDNYIVKENLSRLGPAVKQALQTYHDRRERRRLEEHLRQTQKMETLGLLAGGIAHDFNNLLMGISGHIELAKSTLDDQHEAIQLLDTAEEAAGQAKGVVQGLLTFSRKTISRKSPVNLGAVLSRSTKLLRHAISKSINFTHDAMPSSPVWINANDTQIQQIVMNLVTNARDAMPEGGELRLTLRREPANASTDRSSSDGEIPESAVLVVEDTGVGMSEETVSRIFETFFTTKPKEEGTGLGLSVVHGIVMDLSGQIKVESEPGAGTRFTVSLPCCQPPEETSLESSGKSGKVGHGETIILAEDNEYVRSLMISFLQNQGYYVIPTRDGQEAMTKFNANRQTVDAVILDLDLPQKSGRSCLREIRETRANIPIIVVTGSIDTDISALEKSKGTFVLHKPFQFSELAKLINGCL